MKVKIFTASAWCTSEIERDVNRWFEKNVNVNIVNVKTTGTENKLIMTVMYEEKPAASMSVEDAMIEAARAGALAARNDYAPKESPKPSPCAFCTLCPADAKVCPITGKNINEVGLCFEDTSTN